MITLNRTWSCLPDSSEIGGCVLNRVMNCIKFCYAPQQDTNKYNICICLFCLALNVRIPRNHFQLPGEEVYFHYVSYYSLNVRALLKHTLEYYTAQCRQFAFRWHIQSALNLCYWLLTIPAYSSRTPSAQKIHLALLCRLSILGLLISLGPNTLFRVILTTNSHCLITQWQYFRKQCSPVPERALLFGRSEASCVCPSGNSKM